MNDKSPRSHWPADLQRDLEEGAQSGIVGSMLVSETERVRVWHLHIAPGGRCHFHRHVLDYFWTALTPGKARGYFEDGRIVDVEHFEGETRHLHFGAGEYMVHAVENIGSTELTFTTVEFLDSANKPLPVPDHVRLGKRAA
jgi:hypothetical protein